VWWYLIAGKVQSLTKTNEDLLEIFISDPKNMNACTDGDGYFCFHNSRHQNWGKRLKKILPPGAGGRYTATLWNTLEGTTKRAEKDRERLSGSTHASPSSKFCA